MSTLDRPCSDTIAAARFDRAVRAGADGPAPARVGRWRRGRAVFRMLVGLAVFTPSWAAAQAQVQDTQFNPDRGFYTQPILVDISTATEGATIRYTLDGGEPSPTQGFTYAGPIQISRTTVLRAMAFKSGLAPTNVDTQTYIFVEDFLTQPASPPGFPASWGGLAADYAMDAAIVNHPDYRDSIREAFVSIPTLSIAMNVNDIFGSNQIYSREGDLPRRCSAELIYSGRTDRSFQIDCAIRPHSHAGPVKRALRLVFKTGYGPTKLREPIFDSAVVNADTATDGFDKVILRSGLNDAWTGSTTMDPASYVLTRDQWARDSQILMSGTGARGTFVHLCINGLYWGIYNIAERPDEAFTAPYLGGAKEDWYARNHSGTISGDASRFDQMRNYAKNNDLSDPAKYATMTELLNVAEFSDYLILAFYAGMGDWPGNNWYAAVRNNPPGRAMYFMWDGEKTWYPGVQGGNDGAHVHSAFLNTGTRGDDIPGIWHSLRVNIDFMALFADRVYHQCFNDGSLTNDNARARWSATNDRIREAVICESARWGDVKDSESVRYSFYVKDADGTYPRYTRDDHWDPAVQAKDAMMARNVGQFIVALRAQGYYPPIDPPVFRIGGSEIDRTRLTVAAGSMLDLVNPNSGGAGSILYTTDGSDPRLPGGAVGAAATDAGDSGSVAIYATTFVKARVKDGSVWSALREGTFFVEQDLSPLRITEVMYNPPTEPMSTVNVLRITGDAGGSDAGHARVDFEAAIPAVLTEGDRIVIRNAAYATNNGTFTIDKVVYVSNVRQNSVILEEALVSESSSPATADLLYGGDRFEFVELKNVSTTRTLDLSGVGLTRGVHFDFPNGKKLAPGGFAVVCASEADFSRRYPSVVVDGVFQGKCANAGEAIELGFSTGEVHRIDAIVGDVGGFGQIDFASVPPGLAAGDRVRVSLSRGMLNNNLWMVVAVAGNSVFVNELLSDDNRGARAEVIRSLRSIAYDDDPPWPISADGFGYSLVPRDPNAPGPAVPGAWRASANVFGSPGADDPDPPAASAVLINEVLTNAVWPQVNTIELYNPTTQTIELGDWYLSNARIPSEAYRIPFGTQISGGGFRVVREDDDNFRSTPPPPEYFGSAFFLSALDNEVYIFSPDLRYTHGAVVGPAETEISFGRYVTSVGEEHFPAQKATTLGSTDAGPKVGPVVIGELIYHPAAGGHEFVELLNITQATVPLYDPARPENTWQVTGIGFSFPGGVELAPGEILLLVRDTISPAAFRATNGIPFSVRIFSYNGKLENDGETVSIKKPGEPVGSVVPYILVDRLKYGDAAPWPFQPDGGGPSLERIDPSAYGDDPINWRPSAASGGSPGWRDHPPAAVRRWRQLR